MEKGSRGHSCKAREYRKKLEPFLPLEDDEGADGEEDDEGEDDGKGVFLIG